MTLSEQANLVRSADIRHAGSSSAQRLTRAQRQILQLLAHGDLLWEIADDSDHCTVYNEKRGHDQRVPVALVTTLEKQDWIQKRPNTQADRLDSWEITPAGRALLPGPQGRRQAGEPSSGVPPSP